MSKNKSTAFSKTAITTKGINNPLLKNNTSGKQESSVKSGVIRNNLYSVNPYRYYIKKEHLELKGIIDEELIHLSNIPVPKILSELQNHLNEISLAYTEETDLNIDFVVAGGVMTRTIKHYIHNQKKDVLQGKMDSSYKQNKALYNDLRKTDIDVFIYQNSGYDERLIAIISEYMEFSDSVSYDSSAEYRSALKISGLLKFKLNGFNIEFVFSNPTQMQAFDINHRNAFFYRGEILTTPSALEDIKNMQTTIISMHSPVTSLIRALSFEKNEGYKLSQESIQLARWAVKQFKIDVSDTKIKKGIERRKISSKRDKKEILLKMRSYFPKEDLEHEYSSEGGYASYVLPSHNNLNSVVSIETPVTIRRSTISTEARGYDYPFHKDTEITSNVARIAGEESQHIQDLYWSKSYYDKIVNYKKEYRGIEMVYSCDYTKIIDTKNFYQVIYEFIFSKYEEYGLHFLMNSPIEKIINNLRSSQDLYNYMYLANKKGVPFSFELTEMDSLFERKPSHDEMLRKNVLFDERYLLAAISFLIAIREDTYRDIDRDFHYYANDSVEREEIILQLNKNNQYSLEKIADYTQVRDAIQMCRFALNKFVLTHNYVLDKNMSELIPVTDFKRVSGKERKYVVVQGDENVRANYQKFINSERLKYKKRGNRALSVTLGSSQPVKSTKENLTEKPFKKAKEMYVIESYHYRKIKGTEQFTLNNTQFNPKFSHKASTSLDTVHYAYGYIFKEMWREHLDFVLYENRKVLQAFIERIPNLFKGFTQDDVIETTLNEDDKFFSYYFDSVNGENKKGLVGANDELLREFMKEVDFKIIYLDH